MAVRPQERLEKHHHEHLTVLRLAIGQIEAITDGFDALEPAHGLTLDERVLRDDLIDAVRLVVDQGGDSSKQALLVPHERYRN